MSVRTNPAAGGTPAPEHTTPPPTAAPTPTPHEPTPPAPSPVVETPPASAPPVPAAAPTPEPTPPPAPAADLDDEDRADGVTADGDRVAVPHASFKRLKEKATARGRTQALAELTERAKSLGFASVDEMFAALERKEIHPVTTPNQNPQNPAPPAPAGAPAGAPIAPPAPAAPPAPVPPAPIAPPTPPAPAPAPEPGPEAPENDRRYSAAQRARLRQARQDMEARVQQEAAARAAAEAKAAENARQLEVFRQEQVMREDLIRAGCTELDFTFTKLREHLAGLDEEGLKAFDIKAWAEERRKAQPYLFSTVVTPANTGNPTTPTTPPAPNPGDAAARAAGGATKNAREMTPAEWAAYKKQHGLP